MAGWRVPLSDVRLTEEEVSLVADVLREGWLSQGPRVAAFEEAFAAYVGVDPARAVAVSSGTAALHLALAALGVGPGDEVIVPSLTFAASAAVAVHLGATPVFADVLGPEQPWIGVSTVEPLLSDRTRVVVSVGYGGSPGDVVGLSSLLTGTGVSLVEDAAHAFGASVDGQGAGTIGRAGAFSFFANKNLPLGEGGMVVTCDAELGARVRSLRSHGLTSGTWVRHGGGPLSYDVLEPGFNYRLDEPRAALGTALLRRFDTGQSARASLAARYELGLEGIPGVEPVFSDAPSGIRPAWHIYPVLVDDPDRRDGLRASLHAAGIQTSLHYPPLHLTSGFGRWGAHGSLPATEDYASRTLTLPLYPTLGTEQQDAVLAALARGLG